MLTELTLRNYRGFGDHTVELRQVTVAVGRNNAGKSTIVGALRLLSIVTNRFGRLVIGPVPRWLDIPKSYVGMSPSVENVGLNLESLFHAYNDPPAEIGAIFSNGMSLTIYVGAEGRLHAVAKKPSGAPVTSIAEARRVCLPSVHALPQVAPLALEERILVPEYVRASMSTTLAPLHFRNQLNLLGEHYEAFKRLAEDSWPGLRIVELQRRSLPGTRLALLVKDSDFVAEIAWMGHGLQMWLQTIWFIARTPNTGTIILDEHDVYMHPDLQRRLFRLVKSRFAQVIIATHSVEIVQEADPRAILVIDRRQPVSRFADTEPAVQRLVEQIGSISHLQLSRLWHAKKCLLLEGEDVAILSILHHSLYPDAEVPLDTLPQVPLGGWSGWPYAIGSTMLLRNAVRGRIIPYCILDSDCHTPSEITARQTDALAKGVELHIWNRKELENYLLVPKTIVRLVNGRAVKRTATEQEVAGKIDELAAATHDDLFDAYAQGFLIEDRASGVGRANERTRQVLGALWGRPEGRVSRSPGKLVIAKLSAWSQAELGVSFGPAAVAREMRPNEIPEEVREVLSAIEEGVNFSGSQHEVVRALV